MKKVIRFVLCLSLLALATSTVNATQTSSSKDGSEIPPMCFPCGR